MASFFSLRRQERRHPQTLVAAAYKVNIDSESEIRKYLKRYEKWQEEAWAHYDGIGELHYGLNWLANSMSKLRLYPAKRPDDPTQEPEEDTDENAKQALERLSQGPGLSAMLHKATLNLSTPGECFLVIATNKAGDEVAAICSKDEVKEKDGRYVVATIDGEEVQLSKKDDGEAESDSSVVVRIHVPHPRKSTDPDSPVRGVQTVCQELTMLERTVRASLRSRFALNGILPIPDEATLPGVEPTADGDETMDPFVKEFIDAAEASLIDEGNAASLVPIIIRMPGEFIKFMQHITFDRKIDDQIIQRQEAALKRLAQGMNLPVEIVFGLGQANHWGAGQIEESGFREHQEPMAVLLCEAITTGYYRAALQAAGVEDTADRMVWFDPSSLIVRPDRVKDMMAAHGAGAVSDEALRKAIGAGDDDAPSEEERLTRLGLERGMVDPVLMRALLKLLDPTFQPPEPEPEEPPAITAAARTKTDYGRKLTDLDRHTRERLVTGADAAMRKALERAGARLRSKTRGDKQAAAVMASVSPIDIPRRFGQERVLTLGERYTFTEDTLLQGSFEELRPKFDQWVTSAQKQALGTVPGLTSAQRQAAAERQDRDREDAWAWFLAALIGLSHKRLYDPAPDAPEVGEFDSSSLVPQGLVRQALSRAGGATGFQETGSYVAIDANGNPLGGVGTGEVIIGLFGQQGYGVDGYEWVYGVFPRSREFEPHRALDGTQFENWDAGVLSNMEGWPETPFLYPGDHSGCVCDAIPVIISNTPEPAIAASAPPANPSASESVLA